MDRYPPLKSLLTFDAAMRNNSFSLAAEELCVTPGAVGQQIQKLEEWLGIALFIRQVRQVQATPEALSYWQRIQPALVQIAEASQKLRDSRSMAVWLSMPPSFAAKWFPSRMGRLLLRHPSLQLHLNATANVVDFDRENMDLAIRYFDGQTPQLEASLLFRDEARIYCSPEYARRQALREPADLQGATLLNTTLQPHWEQWFKTFSNLDSASIAAIPRIHFDQGLVALEAAKRGQGIIMASPLLTEVEIAEGSLIEVLPCRLTTKNAYYIVHQRTLRPAAAAVKAWLIEEAASAA